MSGTLVDIGPFDTIYWFDKIFYSIVPEIVNSTAFSYSIQMLLLSIVAVVLVFLYLFPLFWAIWIMCTSTIDNMFIESINNSFYYNAKIVVFLLGLLSFPLFLLVIIWNVIDTSRLICNRL